MVSTRFAIAMVVALSIFAVQATSSGGEIDPHEALQKMFETREKLVSGRCEITGVNYGRRGSFGGAGPDTKLKLVFDYARPAYRLAEHSVGIYLSTPEYQYTTSGERSPIRRWDLDHKPVRDPFPFHFHVLGFISKPNASLRDLYYLDYEAIRDRTLASKILESEMEGELLRILLEWPRRDGDHYVVQFQIWLDPAKDFVTTKIHEFGADHKRVILKSTMDWKKVNEVWVMTHFEQNFDQHAYRGRGIRWDLDWKQVNGAITDEEFALETLPLSGAESEVFEGYGGHPLKVVVGR